MTLASPGLSWQEMISQSLCKARDLAAHLNVNEHLVSRVMDQYPARINAYALGLIAGGSRAVFRQLVPDPAELEETSLADADPLCEQKQSPVPGIVHRYPDRVLFLVSGQCAVYCRHCMRKREVGGRDPASPEAIEAGVDYIARTPGVKEVILSGGDPLMLEDDRLFSILARIRGIRHVECLRIHTRMPGMLPRRITPDFARGLARFHPLFVNIQFNHPDELTPAARSACALLADAGIPLGSQTVLLAGINDSSAVMTDLMRKLLTARVRPYYLHHPDPIRGTAHFRVPAKTGLAVIEALRGRIGGMGIPQYMIDLPGGGGKVPLLPEHVIKRSEKELIVYNFEKKIYTYPL